MRKCGTMTVHLIKTFNKGVMMCKRLYYIWKESSTVLHTHIKLQPDFFIYCDLYEQIEGSARSLNSRR